MDMTTAIVICRLPVAIFEGHFGGLDCEILTKRPTMYVDTYLSMYWSNYYRTVRRRAPSIIN